MSQKAGEDAEHSKKIGEGIVADFNIENKLIGIELTAPSKVSIEDVNGLLNQFQISPLSEQEWAPLSVV